MNPVCEECTLHRFCNKPRIRGRGNKENPKLIIIGEAPGANEDMEGKVFIGRSGKFLSEALGDLENDVFITNCVKCATYIDHFNYERGMRSPTKEEIEWCSHFLKKELDLFDPEKTIIMTLGNSPLTALVGKHKGITKELGNLQYVMINDRKWKIVPNYHPSYILRGKLGTATENEFHNVLKQAIDYAEGNKTDDEFWKICKPEEAIEEIHNVIQAYKSEEIEYAVYDCETSGFLPWKGHQIIMYSLYVDGFMDKSIAIPLQVSNINHHPGKYPYDVIPMDFDVSPKEKAKINKAIGELLSTVPIVGQNLKFDNKFVVLSGLCKFDKIRVHHDTLLLANILIGRQEFGALDLKTLCTRLFGVANWELPVHTYRHLFHKIEERTYDKVPTSILGEYAAKDTYYTQSLYNLLMEMLTDEELRETKSE